MTPCQVPGSKEPVCFGNGKSRKGFWCCHRILYGSHAITSPRSLYAPEICESRKASAFSGQWPLSQGFRCCHSVQNGLYAGIRVSQAPIHRMSSKYANLEWLALFLANGHCHSTWGEKRLKHKFQSGMLPALHGFCPRHGNNLPKLQHDFVLIFVLRIVATVTATRKEPNYTDPFLPSLLTRGT